MHNFQISLGKNHKKIYLQVNSVNVIKSASFIFFNLIIKF
jgi:hypothetical protein